jgi:acyl dehydratase
MLGGYISDLEAGDVFEPVRYTLTAQDAEAYADGNEEDGEWFHSDASPWGRQVRTPTMIHSDKMRILEANCTKERRIAAMTGEAPPPPTDARIHFEYHAKHHSPAFVGEELVVSGRIADRFVKRGRDYLNYELEVRTADGRLVTTYRDLTVLRYQPAEEA